MLFLKTFFLICLVAILGDDGDLVEEGDTSSQSATFENDIDIGVALMEERVGRDDD